MYLLPCKFVYIFFLLSPPPGLLLPSQLSRHFPSTKQPCLLLSFPKGISFHYLRLNLILLFPAHISKLLKSICMILLSSQMSTVPPNLVSSEHLINALFTSPSNEISPLFYFIIQSKNVLAIKQSEKCSFTAGREVKNIAKKHVVRNGQGSRVVTIALKQNLFDRYNTGVGLCVSVCVCCV